MVEGDNGNVGGRAGHVALFVFPCWVSHYCSILKEEEEAPMAITNFTSEL
jgi:hypothetical protein